MSTPSLTGTWQNQHGSVLRLVEDNGKLSGTFRPAVGITEGKTFPVIGLVSSRCFTFSVAFGIDGSITSWVGHVRYEGDAHELETLWTMAVELVDGSVPAQSWKGTWAGADRFRAGEGALMVRDRMVPSVPIARAR